MNYFQSKFVLSALTLSAFTYSILAQDINETVTGNTQFAFELFSELKTDKKDENLFFSPFSISSALAMTYGGARNRTEKQMSKTLHFNLDQKLLHSNFKKLLDGLDKQNQEGLQIDIANSLWAQKDYTFLDEFFELSKTCYGSGLKYVNFTENKEREKARLEINEWVENNTNNKIKDLIQPGILNGLTRLVLVNAIYFNGQWAYQFDKKLTKKMPFYTSVKTQIKTGFMNRKADLKYFENDNLQVIELPYTANKTSMVIFLPKDIEGINELENSFNYETYSNNINSLQTETVVLSIPKFKTMDKFGLAPTLSDMGMPIAFRGRANFSGMTGKRDLFIAKVIHKAFIEVSEEGTEAAAATAVIMQKKAIINPVPQKVFKADHPFIFVIKDNETGSILFMGKIVNPG
ncbi:MAG: serpin family protein [Bacteroidota bacterium]